MKKGMGISPKGNVVVTSKGTAPTKVSRQATKSSVSPTKMRPPQ